MIAASLSRLRAGALLNLRRLRFVALNAVVLALLAMLVLVPLLTAFIPDTEALATRAEQLARLQNLGAQAAQLREASRDAADPFLAPTEERLASADLQALLRAISEEAGLRFIGARALTTRRDGALRLVAVGIEWEGAPQALRTALQRIEDSRPMLIVTGLTLRPATGADEGALRAELTVEGALQPAREAPRS